MPSDEQQRMMAIRRSGVPLSSNQVPFVRQTITSFTSPPTAQRVYVSPPGTPGPSIVPSIVYRLDNVTGEKIAYQAVTDGLGFGGAISSTPGVPHPHEPNSMPRVASITENNGLPFGGNYAKDLAPVTAETISAIQTAPVKGLNFLALDPNENRKPNSDTKGARGAGNVAIFPG